MFMRKWCLWIFILGVTFFYPSSVSAQELLKDLEPDAVMTAEQANLVVVKNLYGI